MTLKTAAGGCFYRQHKKATKWYHYIITVPDKMHSAKYNFNTSNG